MLWQCYLWQRFCLPDFVCFHTHTLYKHCITACPCQTRTSCSVGDALTYESWLRFFAFFSCFQPSRCDFLEIYIDWAESDHDLWCLNNATVVLPNHQTAFRVQCESFKSTDNLMTMKMV